VLQCVAVRCSVFYPTRFFDSGFEIAAIVTNSVLQCVAVCRSVLQCDTVRCSVVRCVVACCSVLQCEVVSSGML